MGKEFYRKQIEEIFKEENAEERGTKLDELLKKYKCDNDLVSTIYNFGLELEQNEEIEKAIECMESILSYDGEFSEKAREIFPKLLYLDDDYKNIICFFNYSQKYGLLNHCTYYYAAKVCFRKNLLLAQIYARNAVNMKPDIIEYHTFLKFLYSEGKQYSEALKEIDTLLSLKIGDDLRNKLNLERPHLLVLGKQYREAMEKIKENKEKGLTNAAQESEYAGMGIYYGDYNGAEKSMFYVINSQNTKLVNYASLFRMYCSENLCDKAILMYENLEDSQKFNSEVIYSKACALVQKGEYLEAKELLKPLQDKKEKPYFEKLYAYCLYLEGNYDEAIHILENLPSDDTKMDIYLRHKLDIPDLREYEARPQYARVLQNYDFNAVYDLAKDKYGKSNTIRPVRVNKNVNLGRLVRYMTYAIDGMKPNYTLCRDVYLVDYNIDVATINNIPTRHFIVEAIENGPLVDLKPVIPTDDARDSYQRVRSDLSDGLFKKYSEGE